MKKLLKISAFIISASVVFTLCACGKNDNPTGTTAAGTNVDTAVSDTAKIADGTSDGTTAVVADAKKNIPAAQPAESENTKTASGDIDLGDGIILPEDGRISFGDKNKTTEASKDSKTEKTTAAGQKSTTKAAAKTTTKAAAKTTAKADTKTTTKAYVTPGTPTTQKAPAEKQTAKPEATTKKQADKTEVATQKITEKTTASTPVSPQDATGWGDIKWN